MKYRPHRGKIPIHVQKKMESDILNSLESMKSTLFDTLQDLKIMNNYVGFNKGIYLYFCSVNSLPINSKFLELVDNFYATPSKYNPLHQSWFKELIS